MRKTVEAAECDVKDIEDYLDKNDLSYWELFEAIALMIENDEIKEWL